MSTAFDHRDSGTSESRWEEARPWAGLPEVELNADVVIVLAAHPDDETLGAGGLIATASARGIRVVVVIATDGKGSHPDSPTWSGPALARERRGELVRAVDELAPGAALSFLGLADGNLREERARLTRLVGAVIDAEAAANPVRTLVVAPWHGDGHRDHRVLGEVAEALAARTGHRSLGYPIWLWHWGRPDGVETDAWSVLLLDGPARDAKLRALKLHATQVEALSPAPGDEALIHDGMRAHFERDVEVFVAPRAAAASEAVGAAEAPRPVDLSGPVAAAEPSESLPAQFFDDFYARHDDPWGFDTRWYEERKRALVLASLPRRRFRDTLELGCATGALTLALRGRSDHVLGVDASETALERARIRLAGDPAIELARRTLPAEWPEGTFDLVVMSEIGYYWSPADLRDAAHRSLGSLAPDGVLVVCHWRHPVAEYPGTAVDVHSALRALPGVRVLAHHDEEDFVLDVLVRDDQPSIARAAGITP